MSGSIHATCIAIDHLGVLLRGPSGAGKSDLALRLIDGGAMLVADDRTMLASESGRLVARPHPTLAGLIEVRGLGILTSRHFNEIAVGIVFDLVAMRDVPRMPEAEWEDLCGIRVPKYRLDPFAVSAAAKVRLAVQAVRADKLPPS